jgi:hypothetical protein
MKLKCLVLSVIVLFSHSANAKDNQESVSIPLNLYSSIDPTTTGFTNFLKNSFNRPEYAQAFLPNNFLHIEQLLHHGFDSKQSRAYTQSVFRLFANSLKGSPYVNAQAFNIFLDQMPRLIEQHFLIQRSNIQVMQEKINNVLYARFLEKFADFKNDPHIFFTDLSLEIIDSLSASHDIGDISLEELRKTMLVFLEISLNKLIWSPEDSLDTWKTVKSLGEKLAHLMNINAIADTDDLNDLFVTLIERYCFFIDIAGDNLPASFYRDIKADLTTCSLPLLTLGEQEPLLEPKAKRLLKTITLAQEKQRKAFATAAA